MECGLIRCKISLHHLSFDNRNVSKAPFPGRRCYLGTPNRFDRIGLRRVKSCLRCSSTRSLKAVPRSKMQKFKKKDLYPGGICTFGSKYYLKVRLPMSS
jgi:hypothetical protein